jgi:hypothetical protein
MDQDEDESDHSDESTDFWETDEVCLPFQLLFEACKFVHLKANFYNFFCIDFFSKGWTQAVTRGCQT